MGPDLSASSIGCGGRASRRVASRKKATRVLLFIGYYTPAFRAGGPLRSVGHLVEALGDEFDFWIVTRDRDIGDAGPFVSVQLNRWAKTGKAHVYYASPHMGVRLTSRLLRDVEPDLVYLNSFFDPFASIIPLLAMRWLGALKRLGRAPRVLLAPHGEFSPAALALKPRKKRLFLALSRCVGLHRDVTLHVTAEHEREDAARVLPNNRLEFSQTIGTPALSEMDALNRLPPNPQSLVRIIFLSRISPMKNLVFALKTLALCKCSVRFDIYGPHEDEDYWQRCAGIIESLPSHVEVRVFGAVAPELTVGIIAEYDLFFLPTLGENYGHVIAEALAAGTTLLISDRTPWRRLAEHRIGWDLSLEGGALPFARCIEEVSRLSVIERRVAKLHVLRSVSKHAGITQAVNANREMILKMAD